MYPTPVDTLSSVTSSLSGGNASSWAQCGREPLWLSSQAWVDSVHPFPSDSPVLPTFIASYNELDPVFGFR